MYLPVGPTTFFSANGTYLSPFVTQLAVLFVAEGMLATACCWPRQGPWRGEPA